MATRTPNLDVTGGDDVSPITEFQDQIRERGVIYEGTRIPSPVPTILQVDPKLYEEGDILEINFGPNHPSTHGVLRLVLELNGERAV